jgi:hypothetical protein
MIQHVHNSLLSETGNSVIGQSNKASSDKTSLDKGTQENFRGALSAARGQTGPESSSLGTVQPESSSQLFTASYIPPSPSLTTAPAIVTDPLQTATPSASNTASDATTPAPALDAQQAFDNAYWAAQPPAVQALQSMPPNERATAAAQLASEGYSIDVPIMVWGWDPSIVTSAREAEGYTWVPSAMQNPVEVVPGLPSVGSLAAYNPTDPPSGSIMV